MHSGSTDREARDLIESLDRPSLYYPYIHIRSEHWLKATLLCAPCVKRIVPQSYTPEDLPNITRYQRIEGPLGALLQEVPPFSNAAYEAQSRLLRKLENHEAEIQARYGRMGAPIRDEYWIHDAKFISSLLEYLKEHNLAWSSDHSNAYGHRTWYALHPVLGSAIMTTLGLSIARENDYNVVTPSLEFHETLLATKERDIFDTLLAPEDLESTTTTAQMRRDVGERVIALSGVNFEALRPEVIPELQTSQYLRRFLRLIRSSAHAIDTDSDPRQYRIQLKDEAEEIVQAWHEARTDLSRFKDVVFDTAFELPAAVVKEGLKSSTIVSVAIHGGLAILRQITKAVRRRPSPYQYLTQIIGAQDDFLRMSFPLGLER